MHAPISKLFRHFRPSITAHQQRRQFWIAVALVFAIAPAWPLEAQDAPFAESAATTIDLGGQLRFTFEGAPWRDVIKWLAEESGLALHVQDLPPGSFTYSDPDTFTHQEAIDRVNLFLLAQGYTLVRSGKLLSVINLGDPRSMQQLDALAKLVTVEQLDQLSNHDVVKCIFPLGEFEAADAAEELTALKLMTTPAVFAKTNRLMITDTVGKLKSVKVILSALEPSAMDDGLVMKNFALQHVNAEDILLVARPHLGLATDEMIGIDVSLSADLQGDNIFVTGVSDKVKLIEGLVLALDRPKESMTAASGELELRSHMIQGGNVETVYNVLLTLLAGKSVRLSMDETAGSIVALATPEVQREIAQTVTELQASEADFEVIPLKTIDPYFAISLLEEMLDLPDPLLDDPDDIDPDAPKIDADPGNMRLFVRARKHQIEQIKKIVAELDVNSGVGVSDEIRIFPLQGEQAERTLVTAAQFWRAANPIILYRSTTEIESDRTERVVAGDFTNTSSADLMNVMPDPPNARLLTDNPRSQAPAIRCQLTPRGLILQSEDIEALDRFEDHLRTIAGPTDSMPSPPVVFYLKYAKPDDAIRMLAEMLDGGEVAKENEAGSLVSGYVTGSTGMFLGSLVTSRQGMTTMTAGTITVVADSRLNRLIAQGTASDIEQIESYLKIIDKDTSITSVETYGTSHVIELVHTKASDVAAVIREAYARRIFSETGPGQSNRPGSTQNTQAASKAAVASKNAGNDPRAAEKAANKKSASQSVRDLEPKMTIAVHEPSNSLIVTAPIQLFREVEQLAKMIDQRNQQIVEIVAPTNAALINTLIQAMAGETRASGSKPKSSSSSRPTSSRPTSSRSSSPLTSSVLRRSDR